MAVWIGVIAAGSIILFALYVASVVGWLAEWANQIVGEDTPWHTCESVSREIAEGLDDGTVALTREEARLD